MQIKTKQVLEMLNISKTKLRELERTGELVPVKKTTRSKYFLKEDVKAYLGETIKHSDKKTIVYYRVSSNSQKNELKNQLSYIENYTTSQGIKVDEYIKDIGSGINYNNPGLNKIMKMVINDEVKKIIVSHKDRLVRFGFELIENICKLKNVEIEIINVKTTSPQEELVEDLMTIIHVFSERLYGLRSYIKLIKEAVKDNEDD